MLNKHFSCNHITITLIDNLAEWDSIAAQWDALLAKTPEASIFNSHYFLTTWWKRRKFHLEKPMILLLSDQHEEILGIAPLTYGWKTQLIFPLRTVSFMYDYTFMDRPQFLLPDNREHLLEVIFQYFAANRKEWDTIELTEQLVDSTYSDVVSKYYRSNDQYRLDIIRESFAPYLEFPSANLSWQQYLAGRTKKHQKKWRYLNNRIDKEGRVSVTRCTKFEELPVAFEHYKSIERQSWKRNTNVKISEWHTDFYTHYNEASDPKNKIHCVLLWLDRQPIAGIIGLQSGCKYAALHSSFDHAFGRLSPGFLISGYDIRWAIENGIEEYDLMSGWPNDKLQWTDLVRETSYVRVVRKKACAGLFNFVKFSLNRRILAIWNKTRIRQYLIDRAKKKQPPMNESKFAKQNEILGDVRKH